MNHIKTAAKYFSGTKGTGMPILFVTKSLYIYMLIFSVALNKPAFEVTLLKITNQKLILLNRPNFYCRNVEC